MATRKPKTQAQNTQAQAQDRPAIIKVSAGAVNNIVERWSNDECCLFDCMLYDNIFLYGLTLRYDKNNKPWVAFPSRKGNDGKYYKHFYCEFADDALEKIEKVLYPEG